MCVKNKALVVDGELTKPKIFLVFVVGLVVACKKRELPSIFTFKQLDLAFGWVVVWVMLDLVRAVLLPCCY